jgi:hypothetical protein
MIATEDISRAVNLGAHLLGQNKNCLCCFLIHACRLVRYMNLISPLSSEMQMFD